MPLGNTAFVKTHGRRYLGTSENHLVKHSLMTFGIYETRLRPVNVVEKAGANR